MYLTLSPYFSGNSDSISRCNVQRAENMGRDVNYY